MRRSQVLGCAAVALLCFSGAAAVGGADRAKRPRLDLRASPRVAFSPVEIVAIGELKGGPDIEDFYCPGLEWDWGDGTRSGRESDCAPFEEGAEVDRFYSARHAFRAPGVYNVRLSLRRGGRTVATASALVAVHGQSAGLLEP